ncbi:MAG: trypsin-like peptidase domain-containing protein [Bacteroidales bacterium]|nr:trypsin-like peptidase domain-containing protein [Bacteroidales bacterium]MBN2698447.1 trypsin-like peptidase domain-containing protein [Bacteroidales bacterium]
MGHLIIHIKLFFSACLFLISWTIVSGQIQHGGKPFDITAGLKGEDVIYVLPPPDSFEIEALKIRNLEGGLKVLQFAIERPLDIGPRTHGAWIEHEGYRVWRAHVISPGAKSIGIVLDPFRLNEGASLFVYNPEKKQVKGAFNWMNNKSFGVLAVDHIQGDEVIVELQVPVGQEDYGELKVESISHAFLQHCPGDFGCSQACEIDINCEEGTEWQVKKRSVVRIRTITQYCTGVLINNSAYDGTPYVLTAEHCLNTPSQASSALFYFNYESESCFGEDGSLDLSISGSTLRSTGDSLDFTLVELSEIPPLDCKAYYAGWDLTDNPLPGLVTIHHPQGDVKKISMDFDNVSIPGSERDIIGGGELLDYHYFSFWWVHNWDYGSTEGGSSGGPLFLDNKRIIGILSGGQASCGDSIGYDQETNRIIFDKRVNVNDYFTRMNLAWDYYPEENRNLKNWLDPINSGVGSIGGYNPLTNQVRPVITKGKFSLYPNPAHDVIYLSGGEGSGTILSYTISDLPGRLMHTGFFPRGNPYRIELDGLQAGFYIISIRSSEGTESVRFIVE